MAGREGGGRNRKNEEGEGRRGKEGTEKWEERRQGVRETEDREKLCTNSCRTPCSVVHVVRETRWGG